MNDINEIHRKLDTLIERTNHLVTDKACSTHREKQTEKITENKSKINKVFWSFTAIVAFVTILLSISGFVMKVWK